MEDGRVFLPQSRRGRRAHSNMFEFAAPVSGSKTPCRSVLPAYSTVWHSGVGPGAVVANVAQLVEQRFRKARVAGSSPVVGSIQKAFKIKELCGFLQSERGETSIFSCVFATDLQQLRTCMLL